METPSLNTTHTDFWAKLPRKKLMYRDSIKYFPLYKHLLQENYVEYKHIFFLPLLKLVSKNTSWVELHFERKKKYVCIPRIFLIINVCNQGKNLCSSCIWIHSIHVNNTEDWSPFVTKKELRLKLISSNNFTETMDVGRAKPCENLEMW